MVAWTFRKKKQQSRVFFNVIWEKELERVIENKRNEFCRKKNMKIQSGCETMRNATGQQGAASKERPARWEWAAVKNKSEEHRRQNIG